MKTSLFYSSAFCIIFVSSALYSMQNTKEITIDDTEYSDVIERYKISKIKDVSWDNVASEIFKIACSGKYGPNIQDKNGISLFLYLMMHRKEVPTIITFLKKGGVDVSSVDIQENSVLYWFKQNFYEFEKEYAEIAQLLQKNGAEIEFSHKTMKFNNFCVDNWSNVPFDIQKKIADDAYLYMNVVDKEQGQTVIMHWLRMLPSVDHDINLINKILKDDKLLSKKDKKGNTIAHCVYENYHALLAKHEKIFESILNSSIALVYNDDNKIPIEIAPSITISSWEKCDPSMLKYLQVVPLRFIAIAIDETLRETYLIYLLRTFDQKDTLTSFLEKNKDTLTNIINIQDALGNTALHYAYEKKYHLLVYASKVIDLLLACGADKTIKNNDGLIPSQITPLKNNVIITWTDDLVKKMVKFPEFIFDVVDAQGKTALLYLLLKINLTYLYDAREFFSPYIFSKYCYSYPIHDLKKIILLSNINYKNQEGYTALDYILQKSTTFNVYIGWANDYWRWKTINGFKQDKERYTRPLLLLDLINMMLYKGYNYKKNSQTKLTLLPKNFLHKNVVQTLLQKGINPGAQQFFDESSLNVLPDKIIEYYKIVCNSLNKNDDEIIEFLYDENNKEYLTPIFSWALARNFSYIIKILRERFPKSFSPLQVLQMAVHCNGHRSAIIFTTKNFTNLTLMNLMCLINNKKIPYDLKDESYKKIFEIYKQAKKNENQRFCDAVYDCATLKWVLSKKMFNHIPKEVQSTIFNYL